MAFSNNFFNNTSLICYYNLKNSYLKLVKEITLLAICNPLALLLDTYVLSNIFLLESSENKGFFLEEEDYINDIINISLMPNPNHMICHV